MRLIFIRHGEPNYETDHLTEKGWREAEILAERVVKWDIKQIYCSPLGRAQDTSIPTLRKLGREAVTCDWLQEFYYRVKHEQTGDETIAWDFYPRYFAPHDQLHDKDKWAYSDVMASGDIAKFADIVYREFDALLEKHGYRRNDKNYYDVIEHNDDNIVFFCHFGITALLVGHLIGVAAPALWQGSIMLPTSITVLGSEERIPGEAAFRVQTFGDARHLIEAGEPLSSSGYFGKVFEG